MVFRIDFHLTQRDAGEPSPTASRRGRPPHRSARPSKFGEAARTAPAGRQRPLLCRGYRLLSRSMTFWVMLRVVL